MAILVTADFGGIGDLKPNLEVVRWVAVVYCLLMMAAAMVRALHPRHQQAITNRTILFPCDGHVRSRGTALYAACAHQHHWRLSKQFNDRGMADDALDHGRHWQAGREANSCMETLEG
jgi:hypothetical protein